VHERRAMIPVGAFCERPPKMRYTQTVKTTPSVFLLRKKTPPSEREAITPSDFLLRKKLTSTFGFRLTFAVCFANSPQRGRLCGRPQVAPTVSSGANTLRRALALLREEG